MRRIGRLGTVAALLLSICACASKEDSAVSAEPPAPEFDNSAEVEAYYAANPDFFTFRNIDELPADLAWQDGSELPDIGSPEARKGGTEYSFIADFPRTLRPVGPDANGSFRPYLVDDVAMQLAHRHGNEFDYYPGLAREWALVDDQRTVFVRLRPEARWSDGEPVTSDDVLFMFFMMQSEYIVAPWYNNWYGTQFTNVTRYDERTFSITVPTAKPDTDKRVLEIRPMPRHFYRELGADYVQRYQWRFQPTTGAYVILDKDIRKGRSITLTRQQDWWAKDLKFWRHRFNADRVHLAVIRDAAKSFEAFRRADIDSIDLNLADYWYEKFPDSDPDVQSGYIHKSMFYNQRPRPTWGLWLNTARPYLGNRDVRVGINYASNWGLVIEKFFRGDFARMRTASDGYGEFSHPTLAARAFDIDKAQQAFARAGFSRRGPDGVLVNEAGDRLSFTLSTSYERFLDMLTILREEALKAGLELRLEILDATAGFKKATEKKHDIHFGAFATMLEMYPRYWDTRHSDNAYDDAFLDDGTVNPQRRIKPQTNSLESFALFEMDHLIDAYRASSDKQEMIALAHRMDELHHQHASFVPGFVQNFYRIGHWRWLRFPQDFNLKHSDRADRAFIHWIDEDLKQETLEARRSGRTFPMQVRVYDQYR